MYSEEQCRKALEVYDKEEISNENDNDFRISDTLSDSILLASPEENAARGKIYLSRI